MPYGVDKKIGGDSPENDAWMERCVGSDFGTNKRTGKPYTKGEKIAICKTQLRKHKEKNSSLDIIEIDPEVIASIEDGIYNYALRLTKSGRVKNLSDALDYSSLMLEKANYNIDYLWMISKG